MQHFISIADHTTDEILHVLDTGFRLREQRLAGERNDPILAGQTLAMLFEKPSLRTRVSFATATYDLGGQVIVMSGDEVGLGVRETASDAVRVLNGMVNGIAARVFEHKKLVDMADNAEIPVINALSDHSHPCQALADVMTVMDEFGRDLSGKTFAFVGDGNNMTRSLATICGKLGMKFILAAPAGYELDDEWVDQIKQQVPGLQFDSTNQPKDAVAEADVIYTDTWVSMGQEDEKLKRMQDFRQFQINQSLLDAAPDHAIVLHCLPAYRNIEITDEVMDGKSSRVFPEAHNRLHAQKGLLAVLMG